MAGKAVSGITGRKGQDSGIRDRYKADAGNGQRPPGIEAPGISELSGREFCQRRPVSGVDRGSGAGQDASGATAIRIKMVHRGFEVRFTTVQQLVNLVLEAESSGKRGKKLCPFQRCDLLILGEFGYLLPDSETGPVLY